VKDADSAAAVAVTAAARHWQASGRTRCQVSIAALDGNSHTDAATEDSV
jgi:6-phosphogluconolactonase (cycloisomerase 2 family)